jgi:hypothetical protein
MLPSGQQWPREEVFDSGQVEDLLANGNTDPRLFLLKTS